MTLKTKTDLQTLDFVFMAQPFVQVAAKGSISLEGMDIADLGQPMGWGALVLVSASTRPQVFTAT